jgi:hypothetical protein
MLGGVAKQAVVETMRQWLRIVELWWLLFAAGCTETELKKGSERPADVTPKRSSRAMYLATNVLQIHALAKRKTGNGRMTLPAHHLPLLLLTLPHPPQNALQAQEIEHPRLEVRQKQPPQKGIQKVVEKQRKNKFAKSQQCVEKPNLRSPHPTVETQIQNLPLELGADLLRKLWPRSIADQRATALYSREWRS